MSYVVALVTEPTGFDGTCFRTKILANYSAPKKLTVRLAKGEACLPTIAFQGPGDIR